MVPPDISFGAGFGRSFDVDGGRLIVGATSADYAVPGAGGAYIYEEIDGRWQETWRFFPPSPGFGREFGATVALHGDVALIEQDFDAYVFEKDGGEWVLRDRLVPPDAPGGVRAFGATMVLTEHWAFIGAPLDDMIAGNVGSIYVYQRDGADLTFTQKIVPPDAGVNRPRLGSSLASDGRTLLAGGPIADGEYDGEGAVYAYRFDGERWALTQTIGHAQPEARDRLGFGLSLSGDLMTVGAVGELAAYAFQEDADGVWRQVARFPEAGPGGGGRFGAATATDGDRVIVGAPDGFSGGFATGVAHAYDLGCILCPADLDADGALTIFDFLAFFNLFQDGDPLADFDGDGELTIFDFLAFQDAFDAGCD
ncbi:MAG: GC-type dockerin domain-anchored protein [Phycisphaerales bacterium]